MSDPERLLDKATGVEARLLSAGLDEPMPAGLAERTLGAVAAAGAAAVATGAAAKVGAGAAASAKVAGGGGLLGAIGIGALAGVLAVGGYQLATSGGSTPSPSGIASVSAAIPRPAVPAQQPAGRSEPPAPAPVPTASAAASPASSARPSTLAAELALLDEARRALRAGDPARARRELDRYAREIPRGQLGREAAMLRAEVDAAAAGALDAGKTIP